MANKLCSRRFVLAAIVTVLMIGSSLTAHLSIGSYAIKVSNGSGLENTLKRALVVY